MTRVFDFKRACLALLAFLACGAQAQTFPT